MEFSEVIGKKEGVSMERRLWSKEEMILALSLYLKLPFGKLHSTNPEVIKLAKLLNRTSNSVALRLVNYAACDPQLKKRGVRGMANGGKKCPAIWEEYVNDREKLMFESEKILAKFEGTTIENKYRDYIRDIPETILGESRLSVVKTRVNQSVFRQIVLANYDNQCALTGIDLPELLVASHIIPWARNKDERLNPANGICLSSLYDKAFDRGLISFDEKFRVIFSKKLQEKVNSSYFDTYFKPVYHKKLVEATRYSIDPLFLEWHRDVLFDKTL